MVLLLTKPSMFGKFCGASVEIGWRFEDRTFVIGSWRVKPHFGMPRGARMSLALHELI